MNSNVRETSIKTYTEIQEEGFKDTWEQIAFDAVKEFPMMTAREYFEIIIKDGNREHIFPRLTELKQKGYIIEVGKRKCSCSGRKCYVLSTLDSLEKNILTKLGFVTSQSNLYWYREGDVILYQDFRKGKRRSYALNNFRELVTHTDLEIYQKFKFLLKNKLENVDTNSDKDI